MLGQRNSHLRQELWVQDSRHVVSARDCRQFNVRRGTGERFGPRGHFRGHFRGRHFRGHADPAFPEYRKQAALLLEKVSDDYKVDEVFMRPTDFSAMK